VHASQNGCYRVASRNRLNVLYESTVPVRTSPRRTISWLAPCDRNETGSARESYLWRSENPQGFGFRRRAPNSQLIMKHAVLALTLLVASPALAATQKPAEQGKTLIYNQIIEKPIVSGRDAQKTYAGKFQVIDIRQGGEFTPGHLKGHNPRFFWGSWDPRPVRQETIPAKVVLVWVVSPEGGVIEPRVIQSPDKRLAEQVIAEVTRLRYAPARLRGIAVFSLWSHEFVFGGNKWPGGGEFNDGSGIRIRQ
jgi:hypothetical protein